MIFTRINTYLIFSAWIMVAGVCAIVTILALFAFCIFSVLHVAMQLQRREIWISFNKDVFLKLISSSIAVLSNLGAVIFGGVEFGLSSRGNALSYQISVCYYLQVKIYYSLLKLVQLIIPM